MTASTSTTHAVAHDDEPVTSEHGTSAERQPDVSSRRSLLADAMVLATIVFWMTGLLWGWGGRDAHRLSYFAVLVAGSTLLTRPWRVLPAVYLALPLLVGSGAFGVAALAQTGWSGADDAASYAIAAQLFMVLCAWMGDPARRLLMASSIAVAGGLQIASAWPAWWGSGDPGQMFIGTFYWHNQAGIWSAVATVACLGLVVFTSASLRVLGWALGPICGAMTLLSGSRGSQLSLAVGAVMVMCLALACADGRPVRRLLSATGAPLLLMMSYATAYVLTGPPFFEQRVPPGSATASREEGLSRTGGLRLEHWRSAWDIFLEWPITGAGFKSFRAAADAVSTVSDGASVASAHNGFLQVLADGGLLLALPVWSAVLAALICTARRLRRTRDVALLISAPCALTLVLHSGMDFDWSFPALLSMTALALAVCSSPVRPETDRVGRTGPVVLVLCLSVLILSAFVAWDGGLDRNLPIVTGSAQ